MKLASNRGFTLVEMVVTVAVMAILIGLSTPAIFEFMRQRDRQQEEMTQIEIRKAMQAYLADTGVMPTDSLTAAEADLWYNQLAGYSSLSANEIENDVWGRPRTYIMYLNTTRQLFGNPVRVYYATIHSMGLNGNAERTYVSSSGTTTIDGIPTSVSGGRTNYAGSTNAGWWKGNNFTTPDLKVGAFSTLRPGGDDHMTRFTNYSEVLDRYNTTLMRMDKLSASLETYARSGYAERVSLCSGGGSATLCANGVPEQTVYYPKSSNDTTNTRYSGNYDGAPTTQVITMTNNDVDRRAGMLNLMNELGLPAEFCCSAMVNGDDKLPEPFFYFSNPRPRSGSGCGARPVHGGTHLPARLTITNTSTTCG